MAKKLPGLTRRTFLKGTAAASVVAVSLNTLVGCKNPASDKNKIPTVLDDNAAISILDEYKQVDLPYTQSGSWSLPLGTVIHVGEGSWLPVMATGDTAAQSIKGSVFSTASGTLSDVVPKCITTDGCELCKQRHGRERPYGQREHRPQRYARRSRRCELCKQRHSLSLIHI